MSQDKNAYSAHSMPEKTASVVNILVNGNNNGRW